MSFKEGASNAVRSVFGRTGAVVAAPGDYTAAQVTNAVSLAATTQTVTPANWQLKSASGGTISLEFNGGVSALEVRDASGILLTPCGLATSVITSGALPTVSPSSGTAFQCSTSRDVFLNVPVTFNPTAGAAATCKVELSPDNVTFSTLSTESIPAGITFDGTVDSVRLLVPAAWYVKLTTTNATLGTGTYY